MHDPANIRRQGHALSLKTNRANPPHSHRGRVKTPGATLMKHRIRAAAIVVEGDSMLLVQHQQDDRTWWVPPGGRVEGGESLIECARRETLEETGILVDLGKIVYVRELVEPDYHHCEIFFLATSHSGHVVTGQNPGVGVDSTAHTILEARFVSRREMRELTIAPSEIKTTFWDDLAAGFQETQYLGLRSSY